MESESIQDSWTFQNPYTYAPFSVGSPSVTPPASVGTSPTFPEFDSFPPFSYQPTINPMSEELRMSYPYPMTPPEMASPPETPLCSRRQSIVEPIRTQVAQRQHVTSGRRRAQNRAAQRAFRERKEKHARDLEAKLAEMTEKYTELETSHAELTTAYEKLQRTLELLTSDDGDKGPTSGETLRKLLVLLHGDFKLKPSKKPPVKSEAEVKTKKDPGAKDE